MELNEKKLTLEAFPEILVLQLLLDVQVYHFRLEGHLAQEFLVDSNLEDIMNEYIHICKAVKKNNLKLQWK